jgi:predicted nucleic acid-binding protein
VKVFFDTNIFLRLFIPEDQKVNLECAALMKHVEAGVIMPYISNIVIAELHYTIHKFYRFSKETTLTYLFKSITLLNLTLIETTNSEKALNIYKTHNVKFGDCFIATQVRADMILCTYDLEFKKIPGLRSSTPAEILKKLQ